MMSPWQSPWHCCDVIGRRWVTWQIDGRVARCGRHYGEWVVARSLNDTCSAEMFRRWQSLVSTLWQYAEWQWRGCDDVDACRASEAVGGQHVCGRSAVVWSWSWVRSETRSTEDDTARLQTTRAKRLREHARRQWTGRGQRQALWPRLQGPRCQQQSRRSVQEQTRHQQRPYYDQGETDW